MQNRVMPPHGLELARRFQSLARNGLAYCKDPYDRQRYEEIRSLAAEMKARGAGMRNSVPILNLFKSEVGYATPKIEVSAAALRRWNLNHGHKSRADGGKRRSRQGSESTVGSADAETFDDVGTG